MSSVVIVPSAAPSPSTAVVPAAPSTSRAAFLPAPSPSALPAADTPAPAPSPNNNPTTTARPPAAVTQAESSRLPPAASLPLPTISTSIATVAVMSVARGETPTSSGFIIATSSTALAASLPSSLPFSARDPTATSSGAIPEQSYAPGRQGIPVSDPTASTSTASRQAAGSRTVLPVAAQAVIGVVGGLIGVFLAYRFYVWWYRRQRDRKNATPYPEMRGVGDRKTMLGDGSASTLNMGYVSDGNYQSGVSLGGAPSWNKQEETRNDAWDRNAYYGANVEKGYESTSGSNTPATAHPPRSHSPFALYAHEGSASGSKGSLPSHPSRNSMSSASHLNSASGSRRSLYGNPDHYSGPRLSNRHSSNRLNGAPHHSTNRIDIVPPLPLAPPPGTVVSTDKSTLDFSPLSGIGGKDSWFGGAGQEEARRRSGLALGRGVVQDGQARSLGSHHGSIVSKLSSTENAADGSVHSSPHSSKSSPRQPPPSTPSYPPQPSPPRQ